MRLSPEFSRTIEQILTSDKSSSTVGEQDLRQYIKLVIKIARPYQRSRVEQEDLIMAGVVGLLRARRDYDITRSTNFKSFATTCILGEVYSYCQNNANLVSVPTHIAKAVSYVERMFKILDTSTGGWLSYDEIDEIVSNYEIEILMGGFSTAQEKLTYNKDRIQSIAKNSCLTYEKLVGLAKKAICTTISDAILAEKGSQSASVEDEAATLELQEKLEASLGPKRYLVLKLHYEGYSNPEIAQIMFQHGYTNSSGTAISRSAVKSLADNAMAAVKNMEIFRGLRPRERS